MRSLPRKLAHLGKFALRKTIGATLEAKAFRNEQASNDTFPDRRRQVFMPSALGALPNAVISLSLAIRWVGRRTAEAAVNDAKICHDELGLLSERNGRNRVAKLVPWSNK